MHLYRVVAHVILRDRTSLFGRVGGDPFVRSDSSAGCIGKHLAHSTKFHHSLNRLGLATRGHLERVLPASFVGGIDLFPGFGIDWAIGWYPHSCILLVFLIPDYRYESNSVTILRFYGGLAAGACSSSCHSVHTATPASEK